MNIKDTIWFTGTSTVGVVLAEDERTGKHKAYIGVGGGLSQDRDTKHIADYGSPIDYATASRIAAWLAPG